MRHRYRCRGSTLGNALGLGLDRRFPSALSTDLQSSVISVEKILDSGGYVLLFEAGEYYEAYPLQIDELLHLKSQIHDIATLSPYILIA